MMGRYKLITCLLYHGGGSLLLKELYSVGVFMGNLYHARGTEVSTPSEKKNLLGMSQMEILKVVISEELADKIFELIYEKGRIGEPHQGFLYMEDLSSCLPMQLPSVAEEAA